MKVFVVLILCMPTNTPHLEIRTDLIMHIWLLSGDLHVEEVSQGQFGLTTVRIR